MDRGGSVENSVAVSYPISKEILKNSNWYSDIETQIYVICIISNI